MHADHLFADDLQIEPELRFDAIAGADADGDLRVTADELADAELAGLDGYETGRDDIDDLWGFIGNLALSMGHVNGEGACEHRFCPRCARWAVRRRIGSDRRVRPGGCGISVRRALCSVSWRERGGRRPCSRRHDAGTHRPHEAAGRGSRPPIHPPSAGGRGPALSVCVRDASFWGRAERRGSGPTDCIRSRTPSALRASSRA